MVGGQPPQHQTSQPYRTRTVPAVRGMEHPALARLPLEETSRPGLYPPQQMAANPQHKPIDTPILTSRQVQFSDVGLLAALQNLRRLRAVRRRLPAVTLSDEHKLQ